MNGYMTVISSGILSTIQDGGRIGFQGSGFQVSGCMDMRAYHDANVLVNNPLNMPVIEMLFMGITLQFDVSTYIAVTGATAQVRINGKEVKTYQAIEIKSGDKLEIGSATNGRFIYLAVAGGIDIPKVMGSYSTNLKCKVGGFGGRALLPGDKLGITEYSGFFPNMYKKEMPIPEYSSEILLNVIAGPQDDYFTEKGKTTFTTDEYVVTDESDRMGYRIDGPAIEFKDSVDILSDGIVFGSIQIPASGKPLILMADRQTTGGYAKIGTIISADLPMLAQSMPGCKIRFSFVSIDEARRINNKEDKSRRKFRHQSGYYCPKKNL